MRLLAQLVHLNWKEKRGHRTFATVRTDERMDRRADKWKGGTQLLAPREGAKDDGTRRWVAVVRLRRNYPFSCVFIFRVITNEVNRNRTKLILLSVEKSHRRLSVHPRPAIFPLAAMRTQRDATRCDATRPRVCHSYTARRREYAAFSMPVKRTGRTAH